MCHLHVPQHLVSIGDLLVCECVCAPVQYGEDVRIRNFVLYAVAKQVGPPRLLYQFVKLADRDFGAILLRKRVNDSHLGFLLVHFGPTHWAKCIVQTTFGFVFACRTLYNRHMVRPVKLGINPPPMHHRGNVGGGDVFYI